MKSLHLIILIGVIIQLLLSQQKCHVSGSLASLKRNEIRARIATQAIVNSARAQASKIRAKVAHNRHSVASPKSLYMHENRRQKREYVEEFPKLQQPSDQQNIVGKSWEDGGAKLDNQYMINYWTMNNNAVNNDVMRSTLRETDLEPFPVATELDGVDQETQEFFEQPQPDDNQLDDFSETNFRAAESFNPHSHHSHLIHIAQKLHDRRLGPANNAGLVPNVNVHVNQHQQAIVAPPQIDHHHQLSHWDNQNGHLSPLNGGFANSHNRPNGFINGGNQQNAQINGHNSAISQSQGFPHGREADGPSDEFVQQFFIEQPLSANSLADSITVGDSWDLEPHTFSALNERETSDFSHIIVPHQFPSVDDLNVRTPEPHKIKYKKQKHHSKYKHAPPHTPYHGGRYRDADEDYSSTYLVETPNLFHVRKNEYPFPPVEPYRRKRALHDQQSFNKTDDYNNILDTDWELAKFIGKTLSQLDENWTRKRHNKTKRSSPLTRLIHDPTLRLDVPKTIDNIGAVTRNALEDEKAPLYHLKNLIGSSKNTVLSAMRIPPQNLAIPSKYEIVKTTDGFDDNVVGDVNQSLMPKSTTAENSPPSEVPRNSNVRPDDPFGFRQTFQRVGEVFRDSVKSSQDTAAHVGDIAHDAKRMLYTAKYATPRLIAPYSKTPALQKSAKAPRKLMLITPKVINLAENTLQQRRDDYASNKFVKLGHILDAIGVSKPNAPKVGLERIILQPRVGNGLDIIEKPFKKRVNNKKFFENTDQDSYDSDNLEDVGETLSNLEEAKMSVGAKSLKDFLIKMKNEFLSVITRNRVDDARTIKTKKQKNKKAKVNKEMDKFVDNLFDGHKEGESMEKEKVGAGLLMPKELFQPFMGQVTKSRINQYLRENGNELDDSKDKRLLKALEMRSRTGDNHDDDQLLEAYLNQMQVEEKQNQNDVELGYMLGAINPIMFERIYNQTLTINNGSVDNPQMLFQRSSNAGATPNNVTSISSFYDTASGLRMNDDDEEFVEVPEISKQNLDQLEDSNNRIKSDLTY